MKIRITNSIIMVSFTALFISCNSNSTYKNDNLTIPKKVDIETPALLKIDGLEQYQKIEMEEMDGSYAYESLKDSIAQLEDNKQALKIDLILLNQLTSEIDKRCQDIPTNTPCLIEENQLYFTYNDEVIEEVVKLMGEESREHVTQIKDKKIPLGEVKFTKYPDSQKYQYEINLEYIPDIKHMVYTNESIKWSKDEKRVYSFYSTISDKDKYSFEMSFSKQDDGKENMILNGIFYGEYDINSFENSYTFELEKLNDENNTFNVLFSDDSNFTDNGEVDNYSTISTGYISDFGASLLITSKNGDSGEIDKELDIFDENGTLIYSEFLSPQTNSKTYSIKDLAL